ncbi:hypothetical protein [Anaerosolibacter sp.]|uniref:hypothetical protein n=1 Tax=Anaerosolibacter sp. TaxID=1872527 RepID=UPI0039F0F0EC
MTKTNSVKNEKENFVALLKWMINPTEQEEEIIRTQVESLGVRTFFLNIRRLELSEAVKSKLIDLRNVIEALDGDLSILDASEGGE